MSKAEPRTLKICFGDGPFGKLGTGWKRCPAWNGSPASVLFQLGSPLLNGIAKCGHSSMLAAKMSSSANKTGPYAELKWHQRVLLSLLALVMRLWWRTLRFHWGPEVRAVMEDPPAASVVILWHNRLFASTEFFRRHFARRRLATLISASRDGAWLAALVHKLGMFPIRGSRHKRGPQAVREMLGAHEKGYDIAVTPDGSRGPMYDLKSGAVGVALKTGAPLILFSLNFSRAWRLKSWDRFYLPLPFSRIEVRIKVVENPGALGGDAKAVADVLQSEMDAITVDGV